MPSLVVLIIDDVNKVDEVLDAWLAVGVSGVTLLDSTGLVHQLRKRGARDDLPLIPSLATLLRGREESHRTVFSVVPDEFDVDALARATEEVLGPLDKPDSGILFIVPVTRAWGLKRQPY